MTPQARTPEELEALLEDAFVTRDREQAARLFVDEAVLVPADDTREARGREQIADLVAALWRHGRTYVADSPRVLQTRDTALVLSAHGVAVTRRGPDGAWRYAISLVAFHPTVEPFAPRSDPRQRQRRLRS
ncbi:MAG TPA: nuclear transport factor 2 family protein [Egibacteraceae bacterium]|nr:nuclear transport factor 2 family protein [Egibacteraceae bacterium]